MTSLFMPDKGGTIKMNLNSTSAFSVMSLSYDMYNVQVMNQGSGLAFVRIVKSAASSVITALTTDYPILPNDRVLLNAPSDANIVAGVCPAGSTAVIYVTPGFGGQ